MILEKDLKKLFQQLIHEEAAQIVLDGFDISVRIFDHASKLSLMTTVYNGGNFIPSSVRKSLSQKTFVKKELSSIKTTLSIDEKRYQINLHYLGGLENLNNQKFKELLEEFSFIADEWRLFLDEHDKNDLVHVRVK